MLSKIIPAIFFFILIAFSANAQTDSTNNEQDTEDKTFDKVEIEATFPGGDQAWIKYLQKTLNANTPVDNGAPAGTFTVIVQFVVSRDGSISEVKALTNHGYGMEKEVIRVIKTGPKWIPALQDGRNVKAYRKQPVTFVITDDRKKKKKNKD
ncbi:MAG: hypothetical protein HOP10_12260 [Chitinophagaceae bacterium]|nr:hypothetical protein [Chitinophagaceae bacterium]